MAKISEQKLGGKTPGKTKISLARDCSLVRTYVIMQCSHNTRHVLHARDPMADRPAGSSSLIFTGGTVEVSMKCDLTKKRFC